MKVYYHRYLFILLIFCGIVSSSPLIAQQQKSFANDSVMFVEPLNSIDELFAKFRGNIIYVDFWGSWCSLCLDEFKPQPELESFINSNQIVRLYVALEKQEKDSLLQAKSMEKWKSEVQKYNLKGYNYYVQLKSVFMQGITEKIMKGKLSLPRFSIIDHTGLLVNWDAKSPSKMEALIKQLTIYINRKNP